MEALPLPDIEIDSEGRPHIAYVAIEGLVEGNDSSGDWFIRLITWDNEEWTDVRNISLPGLCMSLSLQLDDHGYEHLLYWCVVPSASLTQPVILATWNASGLSWNVIADGTGQCELHLDRDGNERFIFMREGGYCLVSAYGEGNIDRSVRYPAGTYPASRDIGDMTENGTVILLFDSMCEELLLYMPGSVSIYPEFSNIESSDEEVRLEWDPMVPGDPSIEGIRVYRKAVWGEEAPIAIDNVSLFSFPVDATGMTDALTADFSTWALMSYRISVITDEGEYIGEMENVYFGGGWEGGMVTRGFWIMVAVIVIASISFIAILWLLIRKR